MPRIDVEEQSTLVRVTQSNGLPINQGVQFLDQSGFPWEVHTSSDTEILLRPMRKRPTQHHKVSGLVPYDDGFNDCYLDRIVDYMSTIEALDREIKQIKTEFVGDNWRTGKFNGWFDNSDLAKTNFIQDPSLPKNTVVITDCTGVAWGPLICDPMSKPKEWPFKGRLGNIKIKPMGRRGTGLGSEFNWLVELEPLAVEVDQGQMWSVIETLNSEGWMNMIRAIFPGGLKLVKDFYTAPRGEDEEEDL